MKVELLWFVGLFALFILAWKPLHRRFRGLGILCAYLLFALAMVAPIFAPHDRDTWSAFFMLVVMAILTLLMYRQKPIEERRPTVAWAVIHGLWDQLAKDGIPADEIERLKKLTQEERARLMASFRVTAKKARRPLYSEDEGGFVTNGYGYGRFGLGLYQDGVPISRSDEDEWVSRSSW
jgi:hypothetical protein